MITDSGRTNLDFRGSISTDVTAVSDHTNRGEYGEVKQPMAVKRVARAQGVYKLPDFMIIRTVGTGSFGRVHLGMNIYTLITILWRLTTAISAKQAQSSALRYQGVEQGQSRQVEANATYAQ